MQGFKKAINWNNLSVHIKAASWLGAVSLSVLIALAIWGFELRSLSRLLLHWALIAACVADLLFFDVSKIKPGVRSWLHRIVQRFDNSRYFGILIT